MKKKLVILLTVTAIGVLNLFLIIEKDSMSDLDLHYFKIASADPIEHSDDCTDGFGDWWDNLCNSDWYQTYQNCYTKICENVGVELDENGHLVAVYSCEYHLCGQRQGCDGGNDDTCTEFPCPCGGTYGY